MKKLIKINTNKMPFALFAVGILSLALSALSLFLRVYFYGSNFSLSSFLLYNSGFQITVFMIVCGVIVEWKKVSYKIFAAPFIIDIAWYLYVVFAYNGRPDVSGYIYIAFDILMICALLANVNKKLLAAGCIAFGVWFIIFRTGTSVSLLYYIGLALMMKRMLEHKQKADWKKKLTRQGASPEESLAELKEKYDAGLIDEKEYNTLRNDIINKL